MASAIAVRTLMNGMPPAHPSCGAMPRHGRSGPPCIGTPTRWALCHCASSRDQRSSQQQSEFHQE
eukprot:14259167-Alexandrium_andersonii.AAC.1